MPQMRQHAGALQLGLRAQHSARECQDFWLSHISASENVLIWRHPWLGEEPGKEQKEMVAQMREMRCNYARIRIVVSELHAPLTLPIADEDPIIAWYVGGGNDRRGR